MEPFAPVTVARSLASRSPVLVVVAVMVCVVLPAASWAGGGRGRLAFTMYSSSVTYRVDLDWIDQEGTHHPLPPTEVAREVSFDSAAPFLAGAETFRTVPQIDALRSHLGDVGRAACRTRPASSVDVALYERAESTTVHRQSVPCPGAD